MLVNAGRGSTVDTAALLDALRAGRISAALDVTEAGASQKNLVALTQSVAGELQLAPEVLAINLLPVGVGLPTIRIDGITVGGTRA